MRLRNFTPQTLNVKNIEGEMVQLPSEGNAKACSKKTRIVTIEGFAVVANEYEGIEGLPEPEDGVFYIVPRMVILALPKRSDLLCPGELIRDKNGIVVGCEGLSY